MTKQLFISYARADGQDFTETLYKQLAGANFGVWWDKESMDSRGRGFLQEIRDAIANVDALLLIVTPGAVESSYVRAEWEYALSLCKVIVPILRIGGDDYKLVPSELSHIHCMDFRKDRDQYEAKDELLRILKVEENPPARIYAVPDLPPHFLSRPKDLEGVRSKLIADLETPTVVSGRTAQAGIQGMGGIGKSVLASAISRDCAVRRAFVDGIFWISVGQTPRLPSLQAQLGEMLGDNPRNFVDIEDGKRRLSYLLQDKRCLVILDDTWTSEPLSAFNVISGRNRLLVTTRNVEPLRAMGVAEHNLDLLSENEALQLLAQWTNFPVENLPPEAKEIVNECGRLPLALAMIGAMLKGKAQKRWGSVLQRLQNADIDKIRQDFPDYPYPDLLKSIEVSVDNLSPLAKAHYFDFAVFSDDTLIPEAVLERLWIHDGLDSLDTEEILDELVDRSLLNRDEHNRLSLHDLQVDYVQKRSPDIISTHEKLLNAYYPVSGKWFDVESDGYIHFYLSHHLIEFGRYNELYELLTANDLWMLATFEHCVGYSQYITDVNMLVETLEHKKDQHSLLKLVKLMTTLQIVYVRTSAYTDDMLETMVVIDRINEAIAHAMLRDTSSKRATSLLTILYKLTQSSEQFREFGAKITGLIIQVAQSIENDYTKAFTLQELAIELAKGQVFSQAEQVANSIEYRWGKAYAFCQIATRLPKIEKARARSLFNQAEQVANYIKNSFEKARAFTQISSELTKIDKEWARSLFSQAEQVAKSIQHGSIFGSKSHVLDWLSQELIQAEQYERAEAIAKSIDASELKISALSSLAQALTQEGQIEQAQLLFTEAEAITKSIEESHGKAGALRSMVKALVQAGQYERAEAIAKNIEDNSSKAAALSSLAQALAQEGQIEQAQLLFTEAEAVAQGIEHSSSKAAALSSLAQELAHEGQIEQAQRVFTETEAVAQGIKQNSSKAATLSSLARALAQLEQYERAEAIALSIEHSSYKADALSSLAQELAQLEQYKRAEAIALSIEHSFSKAAALSSLAQTLWKTEQGEQAQRVFTEAEAIAQIIEDNSSKVATLSSLVQTLVQAGQYERAEAITQNIGDSSSKAAALSSLAQELAQTGQIEQAQLLFTEAETIAQSIEDSSSKMVALSSMVKALVQAEQYERAEAIALSIDNSHFKEQALNSLVRALAQVGQYERAEAIALSIEGISFESINMKSNLLDLLAEILTQSLVQLEQYERAEAIAQTIEASHLKATALSSVAQALVQIGNYHRAIRTFGVQDVDTYMIFLFNLRENIVKSYENGYELWREIVLAALDIVVWVRPTWQEVRDILAK